MDAIADTTVLTNFALIKGEEILRKVFKGSLFTTAEVLKELRQGEDKRLFPKRDWKWLKETIGVRSTLLTKALFYSMLELWQGH